MSRSRGDTQLAWLLGCAGAVSGAIIVLILAFLVIESVPALRSVGVLRFFSDTSWHPSGSNGRFGLAPMMIGTLACTFGAILLAAPLGIASGLFCRFYAPRPIGNLYRRLVELLAGIPSVIYGFWGLLVLPPLIQQWQPPGQSMLAGILILGLMILPTVALLAESALNGVPAMQLRAAAALGLSRWATIRGVALPAAQGGIITGILLATARAMGETMAVLMVAGNVVQVPGSIFDPVRTFTANIALELGYAVDLHRSALFVGSMVLMLMVMLLVIASEYFGREHAQN